MNGWVARPDEYFKMAGSVANDLRREGWVTGVGDVRDRLDTSNQFAWLIRRWEELLEV